MKKNILRLGCCLLLFTFTSCFEIKKIDPNKLPPATQRGAGTFGCKINGKIWRGIYNGFFQPSSTFMDVYTLDGFTFVVFGANNLSSTEARGMRIRLALDKLSVGEYFGKIMPDSMIVANRKIEYSGIEIRNSTVVDAFISRQEDNYNLRTDLPGSLNITYVDTLRKIISGEFYFIVGGGNSQQFGGRNSQQFEITEGRFDLTYDSYILNL